MSSDLPELPRSDLAFRRFGIVEDTTTGRLYGVRRDGIADLGYVPEAVAYFLDANGLPHLLVRPAGPESVQALEEQQAEREARRNAPKPRPAWMRG